MNSTTENLPPLREIDVTEVSKLQELPTLKIRTDTDVELWKHTTGYRDYSLFIRRLNEAVVGVTLPYETEKNSDAVQAIVGILDELDGWINDIPPLDTPQRFGNLAFRTWGKRLEEQAESLLQRHLQPEFHPCIPHLLPYFLTSFGSFIRMDYGTGHETSFALFLLCLSLVRFLQPTLEEERQIVLKVFVRYLKLCWRLQDVYKLEPAGSHGVWGLDDSHFLGYIFGSGQLRDQAEVPPSAILHPPLPPTNLYFMSIMRIHEVKHGPFHEHSSQLHSIATGVMYWKKVNSGLFKMYEAEVLGKRVVVQHIPLGGLLEWDPSYPSHDSSFSLPKTDAYSPTTIVPRSRTKDNTDSISRATAAPWTLADSRSGHSDHSTSLSSMMQPPGSNFRYGSDYGDWAGNMREMRAAARADAGRMGAGVGVGVTTSAPWAHTGSPTMVPPPYHPETTTRSEERTRGMVGPSGERQMRHARHPSRNREADSKPPVTAHSDPDAQS